jgi:hypothetical protein
MVIFSAYLTFYVDSNRMYFFYFRTLIEVNLLSQLLIIFNIAILVLLKAVFQQRGLNSIRCKGESKVKRAQIIGKETIVACFMLLFLCSATEREKKTCVKLRIGKLKVSTGRDSKRVTPQYNTLTFPLYYYILCRSSCDM